MPGTRGQKDLAKGPPASPVQEEEVKVVEGNVGRPELHTPFHVGSARPKAKTPNILENLEKLVSGEE